MGACNTKGNKTFAWKWYTGLGQIAKGKTVIHNWWVYKVKTMDAKPKYNAILAAKGYIQVKVLSM